MAAWWALSATPAEMARTGAPSGIGSAASGRSAPVAEPGAFPWAAVCGGGECGDRPAAEPPPAPPSLPTLATTSPPPWTDDADAWALNPQPIAPVTSAERPKFNTPTVPDEHDTAPGIDSDPDAEQHNASVEEEPAA